MVLAHYYTSPAVQQMADYVGDSLQLALIAQKEQPERLVFASVLFMAEQAKILLPNTEVILPHRDSTCSLVEMTDIEKLKQWKDSFPNSVLVSYVNSSVEQKAISDMIVTSANVLEIIKSYVDQGKKVLFANDRNMGAYLNWQFNANIEVWQDAVCIVHDAFKEKELDQAMAGWTDGPKYLIAHPESPLPVLKKADFVGSTTELLNWVKNCDSKIATIFVATEPNILYNMKSIRPELDIRIAPTYTGCMCFECPWMALNTVQQVQDAIDGKGGLVIDYLDPELSKQATVPINRMLNFK